jgi:DNA replication protein DnaC
MTETAQIPVDTPQVLLEHHLKALRLPTFLREYDKVARQCAAEDVDYPRYLLRMSELELLDRERRATERRVRQVKFPVVKSLDSFDFLAIPSLNKAMVLELVRCEFLLRRENVLLLGNSGTGKTHVALALGLAACQRGQPVRFTTAAALVHELMEARDEKKLLRFQKQIAAYELLIVDELGFVPLSKLARSCSSRSSASATSAPQPWSPATCPSRSGPRSSAPSAPPEPCSTASLTTFTSWR